MSGGAFNYEDQRLDTLIDEIENRIDVDVDLNFIDYSTLIMLEDIKSQLKGIQSRLHHIDWAISGDTDFNTARIRMYKDIKRDEI